MYILKKKCPEDKACGNEQQYCVAVTKVSGFSSVSVLYLSVLEEKHATLMRGKGAARDRSNEDQREGEGADDRDSIRVEYSCICPVHYGRPPLINKSNSRPRALSCSPMHNAFV